MGRCAAYLKFLIQSAHGLMAVHYANIMDMNDKDLEMKIKDEMDREIQERGYSTPLDLLVALRFLDSSKVREWMEGNISFLEKAITLGPQKTLRLLAVMSAHAKKSGYKIQKEDYFKNGTDELLQFSRSNNSVIEGQYSTRYVDKYWREDQ